MQSKFHRFLAVSKKLVWTDILLFLILAIASYTSLFYRLGDAPLTLWDEARYANNAIDFLEKPHLFQVTHLGIPDEFNTKPALVLWFQAICMRIFGISELAVRLPSALFGLFTMCLVYIFAWRFFHNKLAAWLSVAILLCSPGFMSVHNVRTGDLDAALVFWLFLSLTITVDLLVSQPKKTRRHYLLLSFSVIGGFLSKGIAGFFFVPFLLLIPVIFGRLDVYKDKNLYLSGLITLSFCGVYYWLREYYMPGYLHLVVKYEWNRYTEVVMSWQKHPFFWYVRQLATQRFYPFIYLLPLSVFGLFTFKGTEKLAFSSLLLTTLGYFLLISYPDVKLLWYDAPLFPMLALLLGLCVGKWGCWLFDGLKIPLRSVWLSLILVALLIQPYRLTQALMQAEDELVYDLLAEGAYLREIRQILPEEKSIQIFKNEAHPAHYDQLMFYIRRYNREEDCRFKLVQEPAFQPNDRVLISKPETLESVAKEYSFTELHRGKHGRLLRIDSELATIP